MPSRQVYCTHCTQTFYCTDADTCSLCGKSGGLVDPDGPEAMARLAARRHEPTPISQRVGDGIDGAVEGALMGWYTLKLAAAGLTALGIGILLLVHPDLREDSRGLSVRDLLIGIGPIIVGVVLLGWLGWSVWRSGQSRPSQRQVDEPN
jgi:hypothetical protein